MKRFVFLLLLWPCVAEAQRVLLLDRNLKAAITQTEAPTREQLSGDWFPIEAADFDSVMLLLEDLVRWTDTSVVLHTDMQLLTAGHSHFAIATQHDNGYNVFGITLSTRLRDVGASMELVKRGTGGRQTVRQLLRYLEYRKNNRHMAAR
jgi:hypothetical protein